MLTDQHLESKSSAFVPPDCSYQDKCLSLAHSDLLRGRAVNQPATILRQMVMSFPFDIVRDAEYFGGVAETELNNILITDNRAKT